MPNTDESLLELIGEFRRAYGRADRERLLAVTHPEFEWHMHSSATADEATTGRVLVGVDNLITELQWRSANWSNMNYEDLQERPAGDLIVQTFRVSGTDENGENFSVQAVDLYPVKDGKIAMKDTYWKYVRA